MSRRRPPEALPTGTEYERLLPSLRLQAPWGTYRLPPAAHSTEAAPAGGPATWTPAWELIDRQADRHGRRVAIAQAGVEMTYAELRRRTDARATELAGLGIGRGDVVAVVLDRGPAFVETIIAVWKAGAAYLPLSTEYPADWRAGIVRGAGVSLVIGCASAHAVPGTRFLDVNRPPGSAPADRPVPAPDDLAYIICTSGSTGEPKLVMIEHRGVTNLAAAQRIHLGDVGTDARVLQFFHPAYDAALFDVLLALTNGARLEVVSDAHTAGGEPLARLLSDRRITHAVLPAPVLRTLEPGRFADLETIISAGDVCRPATARQWAAHHRFVNGYGPTETTVCTTLHIVTGEDEGDRVPIGRAIAGCRMYVLDGNLREVPDGEVGEICIGGACVGRGYLGAPGLTAERFLPDPYAPEPGARMYRSGDLGRRLADGTVEFVGRDDDQVKIRGARIELGQVERALAALPGVRDAVAVADGMDERFLLGYVTPTPGTSLSGPEIRAALASRVPGRLVPDVIEVVSEWPLLTSGKVDRSRLPRPRLPATDVVSLRTPVEEAVARLAAELLGVDRIGVHENLFVAGAHSLLATQLVARIRAVLGADVKLSRVLSEPTVARIAATIAERDLGPEKGPYAGQAGAEPVPSYAQERVWLLHRLNPQARAYISQAVLRLAGDLDLAALNASLTDIVRRHDVLRSRFPEVDGQLRCELDDPWQVRVPVVDLAGHPAEDQADRLGEVVRDAISAPFSLADGRPFRWLVIRLGAAEHVFVHVEHHIVHDGWSFNVFVRELLEGYADFLRDGRVRRPKPAVQYYDHARWQREWAAGTSAAADRAFWRDALAGAETVLPLPRRSTAGSRRFRGAAPRLEIPGELARRLEALGQDRGGSLFTVLLAAFFLVLGRYTGSRDVLVGSAVADRRWQETEDLLGMFVNTVVFRGRMDGDPSFGDFLRRVRRMAHQVYDHQGLPFEMIVKESPAEHVGRPDRLIQTLFSLHDSELGPFTAPSLDVTLLEGLGNGSAKFDLAVVAVPRYVKPGHVSRLEGGVVRIPRSDRTVPPGPRSALDGITLSWEFDIDTLEPALIASMLASYRELLAAVVDRPATRLSALPLLTESDRARVLAWGRAPAPAASGAWLPHVVGRWAARTPDAPAVSSGERPLSYRELTSAARDLARRLCATGVRRGDVVAVCVPHAAGLVVAQLAVLTAGAAYLPLDPRHPRPRLERLIRHSGAAALVTTPGVAALSPAVSGPPLILIDASGDPSAADPDEGTTLPSGTAQDLAYVCYTSGTTGEPKGVQIEHGSVAARLCEAEVLDLRPGDTMLAIASAAFDVSVLEIWGPLLNGAAIHFLEPGWTIAELVRCVLEHRLTHMALPTAVFHQVIAEEPAALRGMKRVCVAGDVVSWDAFHEGRQQGITGLVNLYGPTEATVFATAHFAAGRRDTESTTVPIGRPVAGSHVVIIDGALRPVPPGVVGEICIGGAGVARGYLGDATLTAERFVPDPFAGEPGARLYRTGDLGRWLHDGVVEFVGRRDEQLKIRGFRVEPGEVRAALRGMPGVVDAAVFGDGAGRLLAYVVPAGSHAPSGEDLRKTLARDLPGHLVPNSIMVIGELPLASTGKIDRSRLPRAEPETAADHVEPRGDTESALASIAAELLEARRVSVADDLFALGLDSLQAMRFAARATTVLRRRIGLQEIFDFPTIAELAAAAPSLPPPAPPIERLARGKNHGRRRDGE